MTRLTDHNPGPWRFEPETMTIRTIKENYWLASMSSFDGAVRNEANAALIAAAPEMLEALEWLLAYMKKQPLGRAKLEYGYGLIVDQHLLTMKIKSALEKAKDPCLDLGNNGEEINEISTDQCQIALEDFERSEGT